MLGIGLAATRDIVSFFRHATKDGAGAANPVAGAIKHAVATGDSQSGNFIKTFAPPRLQRGSVRTPRLGRRFPRIAARQTPINFRFASARRRGDALRAWQRACRSGGAATSIRRAARRPPASSIAARRSRTCPKVVEAFGAAEFWGLRMSPGLIGTDAKLDIPLPDNVRRYHYPGTTHGGGRGGFPRRRCSRQPTPAASCLPIRTRKLIRRVPSPRALIAWVVNDFPPPPSRYPLLGAGDLVSRELGCRRLSQRFPARRPGPPLNPVLDYDFGPQFAAADLSGVITQQPPRIRQVHPAYRSAESTATATKHPACRRCCTRRRSEPTSAGTSPRRGFLLVRDAALRAATCHFPRTRAEREASGDPRLSLEERYGTLDGYVCVVRRAAARAVTERFLLQSDAERIVADAIASDVLPTSSNSRSTQREIASRVCAAGGP